MGRPRLPLAGRGRPASCSESAARSRGSECEPGLPIARGREARTLVETTVARKRLEEMRDEPDRTIAILQGERPGPVAGCGLSAGLGRRGVHSLRVRPDRGDSPLRPQPARRGARRARPYRRQQLRSVRRLRERDPGGQAGSQARGGPLCRLPGQVGQAPALASGCAGRGLLADITSCAPSDSSDLAASSARTSLDRPSGSRRSQCVTTDSENTVRERIQLTRSPAPVNSSRAWSGPKHLVIVPSGHGTSTTSACGRSTRWAQ